MKRLILLACVFLGLAAHAQTNEQRTLIVVVGAPGEEDYGPRFAEWGARWEKAGQAGGLKTILIGNGAGTNDTARLQQVLAEESREGRNELWLVLVGHGTFDGQEAKFNTRGPDVSANELAEWLKPVHRPIALINCASSSGPFLAKLAGKGRVVITATRSGYELNYTRFGQYISEAIADPAADLDKDGQTSLLEAYLSAASRVAEFYKKDGRLATEHSLIDDNGDGLGTPPDWFRGIRATKKAENGVSVDGLRAHQFHLIRGEMELKLPPEVRARRDALEVELASLRDLKAKLPEDEYYRRLEIMLFELARAYQSGEKK
ncbi:MAG TPA: hypothetical protein VHH73_04215 [Verrucomicrobiae bacterium]|nr:hypothetical protein [Verrucomicrobiae bacterium]